MGTRTYSRRSVTGERRPTGLGIRTGKWTGAIPDNFRGRIADIQRRSNFPFENSADGQDSERLGQAIRWNPTDGKITVPVNTLEEAWEEIQKGNYVEMPTVDRAYTLIQEMGDFLKQVESETGKKATFDLCRISVPGTNLFCGDSIATDKYPNGIPRQEMPQLSGVPLSDDTRAAKLPKRDKEGNRDIAPGLIGKLRQAGIKTVETTVPASSLKASQHQLKGGTVNFFLSEEGKKFLDDPKGIIYVSRDGYVIDGHHRWAAKIAQDLKDGNTGDVQMRVRVIDMPIMEILDAALDHSEEMGVRSMTL